MPATVEELTQEIREVALQVHSAQERADERELVIAAHQSVDRVSEKYRELCAALSEGERMRVDRAIGRRISDLRRVASSLPRIGTVSDNRTPDRQTSGASEVGERRITGVSWKGGGRHGSAAAGELRVGGEVDAWCGPCGTMTTHNIVAMVGKQPKQVVCQACGSRHGYRTTPARKSTEADGASPARSSREETEAARKAEQKAEELRALGREVNAVAEVRAFDPRGRYKAGEIISHPEFGRGKIETVLRSSLLVRFPNGGLKSVMLI